MKRAERDADGDRQCRSLAAQRPADAPNSRRKRVAPITLTVLVGHVRERRHRLLAHPAEGAARAPTGSSTTATVSIGQLRQAGARSSAQMRRWSAR